MAFYRGYVPCPREIRLFFPLFRDSSKFCSLTIWIEESEMQDDKERCNNTMIRFLRITPVRSPCVLDILGDLLLYLTTILADESKGGLGKGGTRNKRNQAAMSRGAVWSKARKSDNASLISACCKTRGCPPNILQKRCSHTPPGWSRWHSLLQTHSYTIHAMKWYHLFSR